MATIYDIARIAGVSTATVSHVINGTRKVSPDTARRVRAAMDETSYRPNTLARGLRTKHSNAIGFIVPDIANPFHAELARAVEQACFAAGRTVAVCCSGYSPEREQQHVEALWEQRVSGLLLAPARTVSPGVALARELGLPTVAVDNECAGMSQAVTSNNKVAGELAARHLLELGHQRFACITSKPGWATTNDQRLAAFRATLAEAGYKLPGEAVAYTDFAVTGGDVAMVELLARDLEMTAVFACNDLIAAGAIGALHRAGRRVPADVSVVGVDDSLVSQLTVPPLTSIKQDVDGLAEQAIALLDAATAQDNADHHIVLDVRLVERASCGPVVGDAGRQISGAGRVHETDRRAMRQESKEEAV